MTVGFNNETFCRRMKAIREERGLTQAELADKAGISENQVARYEAGMNLPSVDRATAMADALNCSLDILVGRCPLSLN